MDQDISRLSEISERFSKIGSKPKLKEIVVSELISEVSEYMKNRLPKQSGVEIKYSGDSNIIIQGDWVLIRWTVENLMKNAVDAMGTKSGNISIILTQTEAGTQLDVSDTGKGIPRSYWKNIFRPGHISKPSGW